MVAITTDRATTQKDGELIGVPMAANAKIYAGTIVCAAASGFATSGATATTLTYLGMADDSADNTGGANGDAVVMVRRARAFQFANDPADAVTQASFGKDCFITDNQTVAATDGGGTRSKAGKVLGVDADGVWVL